MTSKRRGRKPGQLVRATCCVCGTVELSTGAGNFSRCIACKTSGRYGKNNRAHYDYLGKEIAGSLVTAHKRAGLLPHPSTLPCVDCGVGATDYDHRDYNHPLKVEPVCRSCNLNRGPAIPLLGGIQKVVARGGIPYSLRHRAHQLLTVMGLPTEALQSMPKKLKHEHWQKLLPLFAGP